MIVFYKKNTVRVFYIQVTKTTKADKLLSRSGHKVVCSPKNVFQSSSFALHKQLQTSPQTFAVVWKLERLIALYFVLVVFSIWVTIDEMNCYLAHHQFNNFMLHVLAFSSMFFVISRWFMEQLWPYPLLLLK